MREKLQQVQYVVVNARNYICEVASGIKTDFIFKQASYIINIQRI